jgi:hypothetical protein
MTNDLTAKRGFVGKGAVWLLLTLGAVLLALVVMGSKPQPAQGVGGPGDPNCGEPEEGYWGNRGTVDFVEGIDLNCYKTYENGKPRHTWWVEVWVRETRGYGYPCPSDFSCTVRWPNKMAEGYTTADPPRIYVRYNHQYWTDTLYANMSKNRPGLLWVNVERVGKGSQQGGRDSTQDWLTCSSVRCQK